MELAKRAGWEVCVVATPLGTRFVDLERLAELAGRPVCHHFKRPSEEDPFPQPNAIAVAPATFNTVNKLVAGIADTLALALLCGYLAASGADRGRAQRQPPLARHPQYRSSLAKLQEWGVRLVDQPTSPASPLGSTRSWQRVLEALPPPGGSASRVGIA